MANFNPSAYPDTITYYNYFENTTDGRHVTLGGHDITIWIETPRGRKLIGRAQSLTGQRDFGIESVYEMGSMKPQEFVPTRYSGSITLNRYLIRYDDLVNALISSGAPFSLSKEGRILLHSVSGIVVRVSDMYTEQVIREYRNCVVSTCNEDFRAGALCGESMTLLYSECVTPLDSAALPA